MTTEATTAKDEADNVEEPVTGSETEQTEKPEDSETEDPDDEDGSNVTPREKELRRLLRENEKELRRLRKADEAREAEAEEARQAEMSESEKLREELRKKDERLDGILRKAIAVEVGLDPDLVDRLVGVTEEEIREDAERLAKLTKPKAPAPGSVGIGVPGGDDGLPSDPVAAHRKAMAGRAF